MSDAKGDRMTPPQVAVSPLPTSEASSEWPYFNPTCRACPRLVSFLNAERRVFPSYHNAPVPPFGDVNARLLVVGLAPGFHGANQTGRPFTGDDAGIILYETLHAFGFASKPESVSRDDGLQMTNCRITNSVKCVPPQNKPLPGEIRACNHYLTDELATLPPRPVIVALGVIAHKATLTALGLSSLDYQFGHGNEHKLPNDVTMLDSFHTSRYNTQTRRLTEDMFTAVFVRVKELLAQA
jgi:uracil-DNA glycosylase family 4